MAVRFGVVGTGTWARDVHVPGLNAHKDVRLVGIWGRRIEAARDIAGPLGITAFARIDEMLDAVDAVSFAVPPDIQPPLALLAAKAGKHLLLEKPVAISLAATEGIADAVARTGVSSLVFFTRRFVPSIERAVQHASAQAWRRAYVRMHSTALISGPFSHSVWRRAEGIELWDLGPHVLSILDPILGPVARVEASRDAQGVTRLDTVHARGGTASVSLTLRAESGEVETTYRFVSDRADVDLPEPPFSRVDVFTSAADELVGNILRREPAHRCDLHFGVDVVRVLAAAELSIAQGRPVPVPRPAER